MWLPLEILYATLFSLLILTFLKSYCYSLNVLGFFFFKSPCSIGNAHLIPSNLQRWLCTSSDNDTHEKNTFLAFLTSLYMPLLSHLKYKNVFRVFQIQMYSISLTSNSLTLIFGIHCNKIRFLNKIPFDLVQSSFTTAWRSHHILKRRTIW